MWQQTGKRPGKKIWSETGIINSESQKIGKIGENLRKNKQLIKICRKAQKGVGARTLIKELQKNWKTRILVADNWKETPYYPTSTKCQKRDNKIRKEYSRAKLGRDDTLL